MRTAGLRGSDHFLRVLTPSEVCDIAFRALTRGATEEQIVDLEDQLRGWRSNISGEDFTDTMNRHVANAAEDDDGWMTAEQLAGMI